MSTPSPASAISLMSTLAVKAALTNTIIPAIKARTGVEVQCVFDPTNVLQQRVSGGDRADVLIATRACVNHFANQSIIDASTVRALVRTGVGVGVCAHAPHPAIGSVDALREVLLNARSVAYSKTGASGVYFATLIQDLGIADRVNQRATIIEKGFTGECVARGEADIAIQQMSELAMVDGVAVAGPLPEEVQFYTDFDVAVFSGTTHSPASRVLLEALFSDTARHAFEQLGLNVL